MYLDRIHQQLLNSKCHIYKDIFFTSKGLTDQNILDQIYDISVICISQLYINYTSLEFWASKRLDIERHMCKYSLKKIVQGHSTPLTSSGETKTGFETRRRLHRINICFTHVYCDLWPLNHKLRSTVKAYYENISVHN